MKMVYVMLMVLSMNIAAGIFSYAFDSYKAQNQIGFFPSYDSDTLNQYQKRYQNTSMAPEVTDDSLYKDAASSAFSDFTGYSYFELVKRCLFLHVMLHTIFGLDSTLALFISIPMYLFYIITLVQIIFRISGESMT